MKVYPDMCYIYYFYQSRTQNMTQPLFLGSSSKFILLYVYCEDNCIDNT